MQILIDDYLATSMLCPCCMMEVGGFMKSIGSDGISFPSSAAWSLNARRFSKSTGQPSLTPLVKFVKLT